MSGKCGEISNNGNSKWVRLCLFPARVSALLCTQRHSNPIVYGMSPPFPLLIQIPRKFSNPLLYSTNIFRNTINSRNSPITLLVKTTSTRCKSRITLHMLVLYILLYSEKNVLRSILCCPRFCIAFVDLLHLKRSRVEQRNSRLKYWASIASYFTHRSFIYARVS